MATASPALVVAGVRGSRLGLLKRRLGFAAGLVAAVLVGGVLWSNALAYHDVWLAPREQLLELPDDRQALRR